MITTKIQNKNKNNFKLISENFKKWYSLQEQLADIFQNNNDERIWELATCNECDISSFLLEEVCLRRPDLYEKKIHLLNPDQLFTILEFLLKEQAEVDQWGRMSYKAKTAAEKASSSLRALISHATGGDGGSALKQLKQIAKTGTYKGQKMSPQQLRQVKNALNLAKGGAAAASAAASGAGGGGAAGGGGGAAGGAGAQGARAAGQGGGQLAVRQAGKEVAKTGVKRVGTQLALRGAVGTAAAAGGLGKTVAAILGIKATVIVAGAVSWYKVYDELANKNAGTNSTGLAWDALTGNHAVAKDFKVSCEEIVADPTKSLPTECWAVWPIESIVGWCRKNANKPGQAKGGPSCQEVKKFFIDVRDKAKQEVSEVTKDLEKRKEVKYAAAVFKTTPQQVVTSIISYSSPKLRSELERMKKEAVATNYDREEGAQEMVNKLVELAAYLRGSFSMDAGSDKKKDSTSGGGGKKYGANTFIGRKAKRQEELIRRLNQGVTGLKEFVTGDELNASEKSEKEKAVPGTEEQSITLASLQQSLIDMGYNLGKAGADGVYGPRTYRAIVKFQKDNGLKRDGLIGPNTFARMREKDKGIMSKSTTMGVNMPKEVEKTLDTIAKAPRDKKLEAYTRAATSKPEDLVKMKDKVREKRAEAIKKGKAAEKAGDTAERNRQAIRANKLAGVFRSIQQGELQAKKLKSDKASAEFAKKGGQIFLHYTEYPKNLELWNSLKPYALKKWFFETWCNGKSSKHSVMQMVHLLRTGYWNGKDIDGKMQYAKMDFLQKNMQKSIDEWRKENGEKKES